MKQLVVQTWEIYGEDEDDEIITIEFDRCKDTVKMYFNKGDKMICFEHEQIEDLKNILDSTKYIFKK